MRYVHQTVYLTSAHISKILRLAKWAGMTVERLFSPFWGVVAIEAVTTLLFRPQTTQLMADLLGKSVTDFLILTQSHTLPYLVMSKKIDVINKISEATKEDVVRLLLKDLNRVAVFALLLQQNVPDMETYIMSLLSFISPSFKQYDLSQLLGMGPCEQALLLLKAAAEADDSKKSRVSYGHSI